MPSPLFCHLFEKRSLFRANYMRLLFDVFLLPSLKTTRVISLQDDRSPTIIFRRFWLKSVSQELLESRKTIWESKGKRALFLNSSSYSACMHAVSTSKMAFAEILGRSSRTPLVQIHKHNKAVERSGFCPKYRRLRRRYESQTSRD